MTDTDTVTLTEDLYDRRDPQRPPVFVASAGTPVRRDIAGLLGAVTPAVGKARRVADVEDKARRAPRRAK